MFEQKTPKAAKKKDDSDDSVFGKRPKGNLIEVQEPKQIGQVRDSPQKRSFSHSAVCNHDFGKDKVTDLRVQLNEDRSRIMAVLDQVQIDHEKLREAVAHTQFTQETVRNTNSLLLSHFEQLKRDVVESSQDLQRRLFENHQKTTMELNLHA